MSETNQNQTWVRRAYCYTAKFPALSCQMDTLCKPCQAETVFHFLCSVFLPLTLKTKTTDYTSDVPVCQRGISQVIFISYCIQWSSIQIGNKMSIFQGSQEANIMISLFVYLSRLITPFLLLMTQAGTWQVTISKAEEAILFWGKDIQNRLFWYSPEHHTLMP